MKEMMLFLLHSYVGGNDATGMAMLEVGLMSGFYADEDVLMAEVSNKPNLERYEIGGRTVYLYLNAVSTIGQDG